MKKVGCIGVICTDVIVRHVNELPEKGKLMPVNSISLQSGGCANNMAIDLKVMGVDVSLLGVIGNDGFGQYLKTNYSKYGVNTDGLKMLDGVDTSSSIVISSSDGERSFWHCFGSNAALKDSDIDFDIVKSLDIISVMGTNLMPKFDGEPTAKVLKRCKEMGKITTLDNAWDASGRWLKLVEPALPYIDYYMPSIEEASLIAGKTEVEDICDFFLDKGVKTAIIKMGDKGSYIKNKDINEFLPSYKVKAVDTNGAGDSFCAGFVCGLANDWDLEKCAKFGNAVGALMVMSVGATGGAKPMAEVLQFLNERESKK